MIKRKRGRPKGSKNKPKTIVKKRGRPKGSKNKPKPEAKKRGRPRKEAVQKTVYPMVDGISLVRRAAGSNKETRIYAAKKKYTGQLTDKKEALYAAMKLNAKQKNILST